MSENMSGDFLPIGRLKDGQAKPLLDVFSGSLLETIKQLPQQCQNQQITTCRFCATRTFHKCLYRLREGINKNTIKTLVLTNTDDEAFTYIIDHLATFPQSQH